MFVYTCFRNSILIGSHECRLQRPHKSYLMERDPSLFYSLHYLHELVWILGRILANQDVWTRKRRKRIGKRRRQASSKDSSWQHPRNHEASHQTPGPTWRGEEEFWPDLRGDERRAESILGEHYQGRCHLHRACQEEDRHCHGRGLCSEETGSYTLRLRRLKPTFPPTSNIPNRPFWGPPLHSTWEMYLAQGIKESE